MLSHLLQSTRFLEQVRCAGDNDELLLTLELRERPLVELQHFGVVATDDK